MTLTTLNETAAAHASLPSLDAHTALFLDFDGTLVDLASTPESVVVLPELVPLLQALNTQLGGALAIVSGRKLADIDHFLAPLQLTTAAEHGACYRRVNPSPDGGPQPVEQLWVLPDFQALAPAVFLLAAQHRGLQLEVKVSCLALHYRHAPELEAEVRQVMQDAVARAPGMTLLAGKRVFEIKPDHVSKGQAIIDLMQQPPFAGRRSVFVGDDITDEAGFAAVHALGGDSAKVGLGDTAALYRFTDPTAVRRWLSLCSLLLTPLGTPLQPTSQLLTPFERPRP